MSEVAVEKRQRAGKHSQRAGRNLDRFEQDLMNAKNSGKMVAFDLAVETRHADSEGTIRGRVCQVDKYSIQIEVAGKNTKIWIAKAMIVSAEVE